MGSIKRINNGLIVGNNQITLQKYIIVQKCANLYTVVKHCQIEVASQGWPSFKSWLRLYQ